MNGRETLSAPRRRLPHQPDDVMTRIPESAWLYTRGPQSVRLVRDDNANGCVRLFVHGPGTDVVTYEFADMAECMKGQPEIELNLQAAGYQLEQTSSDRRRQNGEWRGPDCRRRVHRSAR